MKHLLLASCGLCALLFAIPAFAQNGTSGPELNASPVGGGGQDQSQGAGAPNQPTGTGQLETIVVTAQKRQETAQRVAASIATISPQTLSRSGVRDFDTITKALPDVQVDLVSNATNIAIRGIRESSVSPVGDSPAAVHLDGVYLSRALGLSGLFYDLQRIEELPGPQGTLYGRNATSGVLNLITNKPTDRFGGYVEAEGGNYGLYRFNGALNVPVNDYLDLRGAFHFYHHDGYFSNGLDDADEKGGRLSARIKPTADLTVLLSADYQSSSNHGDGQAIVASTFGSAGRFGPGALPGTFPVSSDPFHASPVVYPLGIGPNGNQATTYGAMAQLDYNFGAAILTAQFGARKVFDVGNTITLGDTLAPPRVVSNTFTPSSSSTYSGEVRLASTSTTPFQWVGGLFYFTEKDAADFCQTATFAPGACGLSVGNPFQRDISYAVFGQGTYTPPILDNKLHLTFGARYNQDKKNGDTFLSLGPVLISNNVNLNANFDAVTYLARISYDITPTNLIYALNSTGFRAGGIAYGLTPIYQPETIQAYEIGSKNRFLNNRLQVNLAGYHYIYKNSETNVIQIDPLFPSPGHFVPISNISVISIGKIHYTGASLDAEFAATPVDRIELNVQYLDAHYVRFQIPPQYLTSPPLNLMGFPTGQPAGDDSGLQVGNTPPWSGTFAYDHSLYALGGTFDGRAAVQFSDVSHTAVNFSNTIQYKFGTVPAHARLDLSVNYTPDRGNWQATAYVNNVTNEYTYLAPTYEGQNGTGSGIVYAGILPPRTFGLIVNAKF